MYIIVLNIVDDSLKISILLKFIFFRNKYLNHFGSLA